MEFCYNAQPIFKTIGMFLLVFKIVIPVLLIIFGMIDLGKAVISSDDKAVSKAAKSLLNRVIAGICIFFIPTIVTIAFSIVDGFNDVKGQFNVCKDCISSPLNEDRCYEKPVN